MEIIHLEKDIKVFYIAATSFPEGVPEAHKKLHNLLPSTDGRSFYGISYPDQQGNILYKAATAENHVEEAGKYDCDTFIIRKGTYLSKLLPGFLNAENEIKVVFDALLSDPRIDKNGYCLEEYISDHDMRCMLPLDETLVLKHDQEELLHAIDHTFHKIIDTLSDFENEQVNKVPFEGSWTAGQVTEHIIKSIGTLPDRQTKEAERPYDEKVQSVKDVFLDFSIKMESPEFIIPEQTSHDTNKLLNTLQQIQENLTKSANNSDLRAICLDFELPAFGYLTRYEWINFFLFHTQRHTRQLKNIYQTLTQSSVQ